MLCMGGESPLQKDAGTICCLVQGTLAHISSFLHSCVRRSGYNPLFRRRHFPFQLSPVSPAWLPAGDGGDGGVPCEHLML